MDDDSVDEPVNQNDCVLKMECYDDSGDAVQETGGTGKQSQEASIDADNQLGRQTYGADNNRTEPHDRGEQSALQITNIISREDSRRDDTDTVLRKRIKLEQCDQDVLVTDSVSVAPSLDCHAAARVKTEPCDGEEVLTQLRNQTRTLEPVVKIEPVDAMNVLDSDSVDRSLGGSPSVSLRPGQLPIHVVDPLHPPGGGLSLDPGQSDVGRSASASSAPGLFLRPCPNCQYKQHARKPRCMKCQYDLREHQKQLTYSKPPGAERTSRKAENGKNVSHILANLQRNMASLTAAGYHGCFLYVQPGERVTSGMRTHSSLVMEVMQSPEGRKIQQTFEFLCRQKFHEKQLEGRPGAYPYR